LMTRLRSEHANMRIAHERKIYSTTVSVSRSNWEYYSMNSI